MEREETKNKKLYKNSQADAQTDIRPKNMLTQNLEAQIETLCYSIVKRNAEFWEDRNKWMIELTVVFKISGKREAHY